jgi:hypothetical protein
MALVLGAAIALSAGTGPAAAAPREAAEAEVKAALLYNFALFIEWPADPPATPQPYFVIGVVGDDPLGDALEAAIAGKRVHDRPVVVQRWSSADACRAHAAECRMVYVSESEAPHVQRLLETLDGRPVVAVSMIRGFARLGGHVELYLESKRMRFEINPAAAERSRLRVSSKLLGLARLTPRVGR